MATLHIVYDPHDKISHDPNQARHLDLRYAVVPVGDGVEDADLGDLARRLADLLLQQITWDARHDAPDHPLRIVPIEGKVS